MTYVDDEDSIDKLAKLSLYIYEDYVINKIVHFYRKKLVDYLSDRKIQMLVMKNICHLSKNGSMEENLHLK